MKAFNEWQLVFAGASPAMLALLACVLVLSLLWSYRSIPREGRRKFRLLFGLRVISLVAVVVAGLQPIIRHQKVTRERSHVVVLLDTSRSMSVGGPSRLGRVRSILRRSRGALEALAVEHPIRLFRFGDDITEATLDDPLAVAPGRTHIFEAVEAAIARLSGREIGAVIVVSDGIEHGRMKSGLDAQARAVLRRLGAPVHAVLVGEATPIPDLAITDVQYDPFGFVGEPAEIVARIRRSGLHTDSVPVALLRNGRVTREETLHFPSKALDATVRLRFIPDRVGRGIYRVSVPLYDGDRVAENNSRDVLMRVSRDRLRILLVCGRPSWDERFLRRTLQKDPSIDLISFFILRSLSDMPLSSTDELSLIPFPTDELFRNHLKSFDVVVFQNFDHGPYEVSAHLTRIRDYVRDGGAFAMVGGDLSFASGGYTDTALADVLPVTLPDAGLGPSELLDTAAFRPVLTERGMQHPLAFLEGPGPDNVRAWQALVPIEGLNLTGAPAPGATVLLEHPQRRALQGGSPAPVLAVREVGRGRTLAIMTDSLWRWAFEQVGAGGDPRHYETLWDNALRWLTHDPELERLRVMTDRERYAPHEHVRVEAKLLDQTYRPAVGQAITIELQSIESREPIEHKSGVVDELGVYRYELRAPAPGAYRLVAKARLSAGGGIPAEELAGEQVLLVQSASEEMAYLVPTGKLLRAMARTTGGRFLREVRDLGQLPVRPARSVRVDRRRDVPLLSRPWLLGLVLAAISAEWAVRRHLGHA